MQAFLFFVKFMSFVSVEQADINKLQCFVFKKLHLGLIAATKSCFQKNKKVISGRTAVGKF